MRLDRWLRPTTCVALLTLAGAATAQPTKFQEAPMLAEQVKAGKLPPVDKRLPDDPLVVPTVERTGQYGGVWRRAFLGPADSNNYVRVVYDALVRFSPDGAKVELLLPSQVPVRGPGLSRRDTGAQGARGR